MEINEHALQPNPRNVNTDSPSDEIYLSIKIGNGQIGGNRVTCNNEQLVKGNLTEPTFIGKYNSLSGKEIEVQTNVLDVNSFTNRCVISTTFINQDNKILYSKMDNGDAPENGVASFTGKYMLRFTLLLLLFFSPFISLKLLAQSNVNEIEMSHLETPSSPGLILFDEAPSSIEKPTTPQGLGLSVLGLGQNGGALEFAPFWLKDHPELNAKALYMDKSPILSHLSISIASINSDDQNYFAGGIRTRLFQTYGQQETLLDDLITQIEDALSDGDFDQVAILGKAYTNTLEKPVFNIDLAAAIGISSLSNSFEDLTLNRWAVWTSFNWRPHGDDFYFTLLARYLYHDINSEGMNEVDYLDSGIRLNYDISKFTLSLEWIQRSNFTQDSFNGYRVAAVGSYKLTDNFFLTTTVGKNFSEVNNIIALAGLNFGFSRKNIRAF